MPYTTYCLYLLCFSICFPTSTMSLKHPSATYQTCQESRQPTNSVHRYCSAHSLTLLLVSQLRASRPDAERPQLRGRAHHLLPRGGAFQSETCERRDTAREALDGREGDLRTALFFLLFFFFSLLRKFGPRGLELPDGSSPADLRTALCRQKVNKMF